MSIQYNYLDGTSGSISTDSYTADSKWYFRGTRDELMAWIPAIGDNASFSPPNEDDPTNLVWCPVNYKITNVNYEAVNRFEFGVSITAGDNSKSNNDGYSFPDRSNLANEHSVDMDAIMFRITPRMTGNYVDPNGKLQPIVDWDKNVESPFTNSSGTILQIDAQYADKDTQIYRRKEILFLTGRPCEHTDEQQNFYHIEVVGGTYLGSCWSADLYTGIVVQNSMTSILDDKGDYWTQWDRAVDVAPIGLKWNVNYGHFIEVS